MVLSLVILGCYSCKEYELELTDENCYRLSKVIENNIIDDFEKIHVLSYKDERLIQLQSSLMNKNGELQDFQKIHFEYGINNVDVFLYKKRNVNWELYQSYELKIQNGKCIEKLVSRFVFPVCQQCWKYIYQYKGRQLSNILKYMKGSTGQWELLRKDAFEYEEELPGKYQLYMASNTGNLMLDYQGIYSNSNGYCDSYVSGIIVNGIWQTNQKNVFIYYQTLLSTKSCYRRTDPSEEWIFYSSINFYYDVNGNLTERVTSSGYSFKYEYEPGKGNSDLFIDDPTQSITKGIIVL